MSFKGPASRASGNQESDCNREPFSEVKLACFPISVKCFFGISPSFDGINRGSWLAVKSSADQRNQAGPDILLKMKPLSKNMVTVVERPSERCRLLLQSDFSALTTARHDRDPCTVLAVETQCPNVHHVLKVNPPVEKPIQGKRYSFCAFLVTGTIVDHG